MKLQRVFAGCVVFNIALAAILFKYSSHPSPILVISQLMVPLSIWEMLLLLSFLSDEEIEEWLLLAAPDPRLEFHMQRRPRRPLGIIHSQGDVLRPEDFVTYTATTDEVTPDSDGSWRLEELSDEDFFVH
ncbi:hypothetical protein L596_020389 [Steinernema carpocapsae]|uniref:Uncharacterized protein n=1 Tax=Steinernema carpocapsae TaxID=34508 RepID=A0A4U5MTD8_STECR|nr:hypothetical protein L596_020389 [Steinernema carpocapsae]